MNMLEFEVKHWDSGKEYIAGIDEAGRGPLAGPVVSAAVILPQDIDLPEVNDSKKISEKKRERLFDEINNTAQFWTASPYSENEEHSWANHLAYHTSSVFHHNTKKQHGFSVRCLKD